MLLPCDPAQASTGEGESVVAAIAARGSSRKQELHSAMTTTLIMTAAVVPPADGSIGPEEAVCVNLERIGGGCSDE